MSQFETIMLVILGFAVALLLALILGKLLWGQAIGLGKRRARRENPVTVAVLQADKDKLRAEAAMLSRKLELRLNDLKTRLAEQTAEVSRNRNRVDHLAGEIKERDTLIANRDEELQALKTQVVPLEEELVIRTQNAQQLKENLRDSKEQLQNKTLLIDDLQEQLKVALSTNAIVGQTDISTRENLQDRISDLTDLSRQIEQQRLQLTRQHSELKNFTGETANTSPIEKKLAEAERETDQLQEELARLDDDWSEKLKQLDENKLSSAKTENPSKDDSENQQEPSNVVSLASRIRSLQSDIKDRK